MALEICKRQPTPHKSKSPPTQMSDVSLDFDLHSNSLTSSLPSELGLFDQLTSTFWLSTNKISSTVRSHLGLLSSQTSHRGRP